MEIKKEIIITLDTEDIKNLQCLLDFCNIQDIIRSNVSNLKGYQQYEIKAAYELYDKINDL